MQEISFREHILPLKDKLFRVAWRITLDKAEAEDVVQDVMIRLWGKREEWAKIESIEAFALTMTRNLSIDRAELKAAQNLPLSEEFETVRETSETGETMEQHEQLHIIHKLISELPEKQRTIMQLRDIEGCSYKEIAEILKITEEQVKVNLFRARQKVKQYYIQIDEYGL